MGRTYLALNFFELPSCECCLCVRLNMVTVTDRATPISLSLLVHSLPLFTFVAERAGGGGDGAVRAAGVRSASSMIAAEIKPRGGGEGGLLPPRRLSKGETLPPPSPFHLWLHFKIIFGRMNLVWRTSGRCLDLPHRGAAGGGQSP